MMGLVQETGYSTVHNKNVFESLQTGTTVVQRLYENIFNEIIVNESDTYFSIPIPRNAVERVSSPIDEGRKEYQIMRSRLMRLFSIKKEDIGDEEGAVTPTTYANSRVEKLLADTYSSLMHDFYKGSATTSFEGGIRVEWMRSNASVRLVVSSKANGKEYIYFELENESGLEAVSVNNLVNRLRWLRQVEKPWPKK